MAIQQLHPYRLAVIFAAVLAASDAKAQCPDECWSDFNGRAQECLYDLFGCCFEWGYCWDFQCWTCTFLCCAPPPGPLAANDGTTTSATSEVIPAQGFAHDLSTVNVTPNKAKKECKKPSLSEINAYLAKKDPSADRVPQQPTTTATPWDKVPAVPYGLSLGEQRVPFYKALQSSGYEKFKRCVGSPEGRPEVAKNPTTIILSIETDKDVMNIVDAKIANAGHANSRIASCLVEVFRISLEVAGTSPGLRYRVVWPVQFRPEAKSQ